MYYCDEDELNAIAKVIKSKKLFRYQGPNVPTECFDFEKEFAHYLGTNHSILLSSGTNALITAMSSLGIKSGDEIIVPAYTFFATIAAILEIGAIPVIVNIDQYLCIDPDEILKAISPNTKAIIPVHMDGYACNMPVIMKIALEHSLFIIEDVAQALGATFNNKKLGTFGNVGCFSFNVDKIITCGEGGAVALNSLEIYQKAMMFHDTCNQFGPTLKNQYTINPFSGRSMRVSEIQGAMIRVQLHRLDKIIFDLKARKVILEDHLKSLHMNLVPTYESKTDNGTTTRIKMNNPEEVKNAILETQKIGFKSTSPIFRPAHNILQWKHLLPTDKRNNKINFLSTIDQLSSTLNIHISLDGPFEDWTRIVHSLNLNNFQRK
jgi:8-amino-3,8-dideoxy-alpha-D-manno-octulosonate transaminase